MNKDKTIGGVVGAVLAGSIMVTSSVLGAGPQKISDTKYSDPSEATVYDIISLTDQYQRVIASCSEQKNILESRIQKAKDAGIDYASADLILEASTRPVRPNK